MCIRDRYLEAFNDLTFDELPRQYVRRIRETPIVAYTVEDVYKRQRQVIWRAL